MEETFGDIEGVGIISDDTIISGKNKEHHDKNLQLVMQRAARFYVRSNLEKVGIRIIKCPILRLHNERERDSTGLRESQGTNRYA